MEKEEKLKEYKKKNSVLKQGLKKMREKLEGLEKENQLLRSKVGIADGSEKLNLGMSDEDMRGLKEKFEKEAYKSNLVSLTRN